jgi:hypothetical protein
MMKKHLDRYARWAKGSQQLVGRYFDENAGRTGNPIPTIIVGDHVVRAAMPRRSTTTRCSAPSRTPRCRRVPVSKICVNYLGHQGTNEWAGVPTDQDARPADSVADALGLRQQWCGAKLLSILVVPGCSTTIIDQPSSVGRMQPLEAVK